MHAHITKLVALVCIILFVVSWSSFLRQYLPSSYHEGPKSIANPILNSTLGFQAIYALALPDRMDRVQPLLKAANATNITVTTLDAVRDRQIPKDAWPQTWASNREPKVGELGCLISHVRTWKKMVAEKIGSAIIMESDSDWDMRIRDIMVPLGEGVKTLVDWPFNATEESAGLTLGHSPYGDKWDIIWVGHCGANNNGDGRFWRVNDTSVPDVDHEYWFGSGPQDEQKRPGTRMLYQIRGAVCSTAYAISHQGAVKLVEYFKSTADNIDLALGWFCDHKTDMACVGVWPQIITAAATKSNIEHPDSETAQHEEDDKVHPGPALQYSARVNAEKAMKGLGKEHWKAEWDFTWAMKQGKWTQVTLKEAKILEEVDAFEKMNVAMVDNPERGKTIEEVEGLKKSTLMTAESPKDSNGELKTEKTKSEN